MTYTITSGKLHVSVEADSPIEAAKIALHECGTGELDSIIEVMSMNALVGYNTEYIITLLGHQIL